jgi:hypothetical protein
MFAADTSAIRARFEALWPAKFTPAVPHCFADERTPASFTSAKAPWVRLTIIPGKQTQVEMGNQRRFRRIGLVVLDVFVPAGSGEGRAMELCDAFADIFMARTISGIVFRATSVDRVGTTDAWTQFSASTPYQSDSLI